MSLIRPDAVYMKLLQRDSIAAPPRVETSRVSECAIRFLFPAVVSRRHLSNGCLCSAGSYFSTGLSLSRVTGCIRSHSSSRRTRLTPTSFTGTSPRPRLQAPRRAGRATQPTSCCRADSTRRDAGSTRPDSVYISESNPTTQLYPLLSSSCKRGSCLPLLRWGLSCQCVICYG